MRSLVSLALVLVAAAGAILLVQRRSGTEVADDAPTALGRSPDSAPVVESDNGATSEPEIASIAIPDTVRTTVPVEPVAPGRCVVQGRLVDGAGAPVEGALVRLFAKRRWARDSNAAALTDLDPSGELVGFEARTGEDGRFRLNVDPPSARTVDLHASHSPLVEVVRRQFGRGGEEALTEGVRDLGDLTMRAAGAVRGVVIGEDGEGLEGAAVEIMSLDSGRPVATARSDSEGGFELAHCAPASYDLRATLDGRVTRTLAGVVVTAERWSGPHSLRMTRGPEVSGRVVDEAGTPLVGARVRARFESGRTAASTKTDAEGAFRAVLASTDDVQISASLDGHLTASVGPVATPTRKIEVVLKRESRSRVRVVDRASGQPVERFGIVVVEDGGSRSPAPHFVRRRTPRIADQPGGVAEVSGRIGLDLVVVQPEGFVPALADLGGAQWPRVDALPPSGQWRAFAPDEGPFEQTILLDRGATLRGEFAVGAWRRADLALSRVDEREVRFRFLDNAVRNTDCTSEAPRFDFAGLEPGTWQLSARTDAGTSRVVRAIELVANETQDLGLLELVPSGTVTGSVELPAHANVGEVSILVADVPLPIAGIVDADGRFRIEGVPAGERTIRNQTLHPDLMWGGEVQVVVPPGGEVDVFLDLSRRGLLPIEVTVELDGETFPGAEVRLVREDVWPTRTIFDMFEDREIYLGSTHTDGVARGRGRALGATRPAIAIDGWKVFSPQDARVVLEGASPIEARVALRSGEAVLVLPEGAALPTNGSVRFAFESTADPRVRSWTTVQLENGVPIHLAGLVPDPTLSTWRVSRLPPGEWTFRVDLFETGVGEQPLGSSKEGAESAIAARTRLVARGRIESGGTARLELAPE